MLVQYKNGIIDNLKNHFLAKHSNIILKIYFYRK
jgi:hypothetical protein